MSKDNAVFDEVQAALLNSDCDPNEAGIQGLCALYSFVATELDGSTLALAVADALAKVHAHRRLPTDLRKDLRNRVLTRYGEARPRRS
jgi:hypothetical protein